MKRYFVKAPISGWHEVDRSRFLRFIDHLKKCSTPTIPINDLIKSRTKIKEDD